MPPSLKSAVLPLLLSVRPRGLAPARAPTGSAQRTGVSPARRWLARPWPRSSCSTSSVCAARSPARDDRPRSPSARPADPRARARARLSRRPAMSWCSVRAVASSRPMFARPARRSRSSPASGRWATGRRRSAWTRCPVVAGGAGRAGLRLRLEALGHFRDPGARGVYSRPAHPGRRPAVGVPDRQLAGWQPVRVRIGGASYWSLTPTPGLGPQTPHSRRDANVARL